jgi:IS1 family transposase
MSGIEGNPDPKHISISLAERQNLNLRMHMRRFTRLTHCFFRSFRICLSAALRSRRG